jgi:hypothetical protein
MEINREILVKLEMRSTIQYNNIRFARVPPRYENKNFPRPSWAKMAHKKGIQATQWRGHQFKGTEING